jgi:hypothetical protein
VQTYLPLQQAKKALVVLPSVNTLPSVIGRYPIEGFLIAPKPSEKISWALYYI